MLREMRGQLPRHRLDPLDDAALEIARFEIGLHRLADFVPALAAYLGVDAAVGDDLDFAVGGQQIDQYAVVVGAYPDPQIRKNIHPTPTSHLILKHRDAVND